MYMVVLITCPDANEGKRIADILLRERLAACVNIISDVNSYFWWAGKVHHAEEVLLMAKTKEKLLRKLVRRAKENHQYENPEVIALPIVGGSKEFTRWIEEETA